MVNDMTEQDREYYNHMYVIMSALALVVCSESIIQYTLVLASTCALLIFNYYCSYSQNFIRVRRMNIYP